MNQLQGATTIPLWPVGADGRCTCAEHPNCKRPGKHPARNAPGPGYAVVTGTASGVFVVDVDVKGGVNCNGFDQLVALGELPETLIVSTPSTGAHFYLKSPGFKVRNRKPASAIDIKGDPDRDDGLVYVVGPGSPGYTKTSDPCVVEQAESYAVYHDAPIADAPEWLLSWLRIGDDKRDTFAPVEIDESHPDWDYRVELGIKAAKEFPPSRADGEAGKRLFNIGVRLVRALELPLEKAFEIISEHFNPRCTQSDGVTPYPWSDDDIVHKLQDNRDRSEIPTGIPSRATTEGIKALAVYGQPPYKRPEPEHVLDAELVEDEEVGAKPKASSPRKTRRPGHKYSIQVGNLATPSSAEAANQNDVIQRFSSGSYWEGCWQYDEFSDEVLCVDPPMKLDAETKGLSPDDLSVLRSYLEHIGMIVREPDVQKAVRVAAKSRSFHPVREYLASLPAGDPSIFDGLAKRLFGTDEPKADDFLRKFLVSSVRRTLVPGTQVDTVLVLYGPQQGEGKTTFVEALFEERWTRRGLPADLASRDASHALVGYRCIELGELSSLLRTEKNAAKDFITWRDDVYRQYGNGERIKRPRECVFVGTTNDDDFLRDATGNRRFWVIAVERGHQIPTPWVREHRDQLWAAALTLAKDATFRHYFTAEEEVEVNATREAYQEEDPWQETIFKYCQGKSLVTTEDVYLKAIFGEMKGFGRRERLRVVDSLRRIGCTSKFFKGVGKRWVVPGSLENMKAEVSKLRALKGGA